MAFDPLKGSLWHAKRPPIVKPEASFDLPKAYLSQNRRQKTGFSPVIFPISTLECENEKGCFLIQYFYRSSLSECVIERIDGVGFVGKKEADEPPLFARQGR